MCIRRLVSPRHVIQSIWTVAGSTGQYRTKGGVVNVPVSVDNTVSQLPRAATDSNVIHLQLARRLIYQRNYAYGNIRPALVWEAARYLQSQPLFQGHGITLSDGWL